jgi:hypothetical protein
MEFYLSSRPCAKCGCLNASVRRTTRHTIPHARAYAPGEPVITEYPFKEVMERKCPRCGHTWDEKPLDAKSEPEPVTPKRGLSGFAERYETFKEWWHSDKSKTFESAYFAGWDAARAYTETKPEPPKRIENVSERPHPSCITCVEYNANTRRCPAYYGARLTDPMNWCPHYEVEPNPKVVQSRREILWPPKPVTGPSPNWYDELNSNTSAEVAFAAWWGSVGHVCAVPNRAAAFKVFVAAWEAANALIP